MCHVLPRAQPLHTGSLPFEEEGMQRATSNSVPDLNPVPTPSTWGEG